MTEQFLIGTYTKKDSKGVYKVTLDPQKEEITKVELAIPSQKPAYLQVGSDKRVYAVKQIDDQGGVASYSLKDDNAKMLSKVLAAGAPPAYVGLDEKRHLLYSANYHTAKVDVFKINDDGTLTQTDSVLHQGATGPQPEQDSPHVHFADLTPDQSLVVCDLGMDLVVVYDVSADGTFSHVQTIKTIPDDWTAHNGAAAIRLSKDGKFIYTSNRGENTIAVFEVQPDFTVKHIQSISTEGDFPRDFNLSSDESFLLASNQNSDNLTLYKRDPETGKLTLLQKDVACPEPVCVQRF